MSRNTHAAAVCPIETWSGQTLQSLTETWGGTQKAHCHLTRLLWHSWGGMDPHLPQEGEWWVLWGGGGSWTSHLGVGKLCCLSPAWPQQHPPAGHGDFSCEELLSLMRSTCKKGGSKDLSSSR